MNTNIALLQGSLKQLPQLDCEVINHFSPGVYIRECRMPALSFIIGKTHKTEHFNQVFDGECFVSINGEPKKLYKAPSMFKSNSGDKKFIFAIKPTIWLTIHPTDETDLDKLEEELIDTEAELKLSLDYTKLIQELLWVG